MKRLTPYLLSRPSHFIFLFCLISHALLLLHNGVLWDDWTIYKQESEAISSQFSQNAGIFFWRIHLILAWFGHPILVYRLLTFVLYYTLTLYFVKLLARLTRMEERQQIILGVLFAVLPFTISKSTLVISILDAPLLFFVGSLWIYLTRQGVAFRLLALTLLFLSFALNSLLAFSWIIPVILLAEFKPKTLRDSILLFLRKLDILAIPFLFYAIKTFYLVPKGLYAKYNAIESSIVGRVGENISLALDRSLWTQVDHIKILFSDTGYIWLVLIVFALTGILAFVFHQRYAGSTTLLASKLLVFAAFGVLLVLSAILPYALVDKIPEYADYLSRHQILLPFGISLLLYVLIRAMERWQMIQLAIFAVIVAMSISVKTYLQIELQNRWFRMDAIQAHLTENETLSQASSIKLIDDGDKYGEFEVRFYVFGGLLREANLPLDKLIMTERKFQNTKRNGLFEKFVTHAQYNVSDYIIQEHFQAELRVSDGPGKPESLGQSMHLLWLYYTNKPAYDRISKTIVHVEAKPVFAQVD